MMAQRVLAQLLGARLRLDMAVVLAVLLAINAARMWWFTGPGQGAPGTSGVCEKLYTLPLHFFTQKRYGTLRATNGRGSSTWG